MFLEKKFDERLNEEWRFDALQSFLHYTALYTICRRPLNNDLGNHKAVNKFL